MDALLIQADDDVDQTRIYRETTELFNRSRDYFKQHHQILISYSLLKLIASASLVRYILIKIAYDSFATCSEEQDVWGKDYLQTWMIVSMAHSLGALIYYSRLLYLIGGNCIELSMALDHCIEFEVPEEDSEAYITAQVEYHNNEVQLRMELEGQFDESRKITQLAQEIKKKLCLDPLCNYLGKTCFAIFQILQLWGLIFYFTNYSLTIVCQEYYCKYLFLVVFMGLYQYLEIYIMAILIIIFLPVLLFYTCYDLLKKYIQQRRHRVMLDESITESLVTSEQLSNECAICMQQYQENDPIVILKCSDKHHFHSDCIKSWLQVNNKCPLCRNDIYDLPL